jgi:hypothetical protein
MLAVGPAEEEVQGFGSTVAGVVPVMFAQCTASPHGAGNVGTVTGVGGRDSGHVRCAAWTLTPPDTRTMLWSG